MYNYYQTEPVEQWSSLGQGPAWDPDAHVELDEAVFGERWGREVKAFVDRAMSAKRPQQWLAL